MTIAKSPMPVCTYRGVSYEKASLPKQDLLKYDRKIYNDRLQNASKELRMVYRWVRHRDCSVLPRPRVLKDSVERVG